METNTKCVPIAVMLGLTLLCYNGQLQAKWNSTKASQPLSDVIELITSSTVIVKTEFTCRYEGVQSGTNASRTTDEEEFTIMGTGFIADTDSHIVTASHVVDPTSPDFQRLAAETLKQQGRRLIKDSIRVTQIEVRAVAPNIRDRTQLFFDGSERYDATLLRSDTQKDISVLTSHDLKARVLSGKNIPLVLTGRNGRDVNVWSIKKLRVAALDSGQPRFGEDVAVIGFPRQYEVSNERSWTAGPTVTYGKISNPLELDPEHGNRAEILADVRVTHGNSGGPAFRQSDGKVIGVAVFSRSSGLVEIIPASDVIELLKTTDSTKSY